MVGLHFAHKEFAWLLVSVIIFAGLFILLLLWKKKVRQRIGDARLVKALTGTYSHLLFNIKFGFLSLAFVAGVVSAMNLQKPGGEGSIQRKGIDLVIALDVSKSMLATDITPNRLERAKQLVIKLMSELPEDRIGLVVFAGRAYLQMPLTADHGAASMYVSSANADAVPQQGTVISEALQMSAKAFNQEERRFKTVVLISDGEDHDVNAVKMAKNLSQQGMMINTVGIGLPEGTPIPDASTGTNKKDEYGNDIISRLNESELKQIAESTNGIYIRLEDAGEAVRLLKDQLDKIESKAFGDVSLMNFKTYYWWFAIAMFVLLVTEYFTPEIKRHVA
jgi:Ca-activated chloride channel family protein